jgi:pimeloyl-ACP methyl ester carboxylesterase
MAEDAIAFIEALGFAQVDLFGFSLGGFVARHVADRMPDRIRSLIYLDAFVPENGKTLFDYLPDNGDGDRKLAVANGDGW